MKSVHVKSLKLREDSSLLLAEPTIWLVEKGNGEEKVNLKIMEKQEEISSYSDLDVGSSVFKNKSMFWMIISNSKTCSKCSLKLQALYDL